VWPLGRVALVSEGCVARRGGGCPELERAVQRGSMARWQRDASKVLTKEALRGRRGAQHVFGSEKEEAFEWGGMDGGLPRGT
jgi:hypothetical protein